MLLCVAYGAIYFQTLKRASSNKQVNGLQVHTAHVIVSFLFRREEEKNSQALTSSLQLQQCKWWLDECSAALEHALSTPRVWTMILI